MPNQTIDTAYEAYANACARFWLMSDGPLGEGDVDHFPVSADLFAAAFQSIPPVSLSGFQPTYDGMRGVVTWLADERPLGWNRLTKSYGRNSLGFLLVAAMAECNPSGVNFHGRLTAELGTERRATDLRNDLEGLWVQLRGWVERERGRSDSDYKGIRTLRLESYADSMVRIGTTVELAFPNREDRQIIDPAIRELSRETDPPVAAVVSALGRIARSEKARKHAILQRAISDFQKDPFHCRGIAGCLKAILIQRLSEAAEEESSGCMPAAGAESAAELLFYRQEDSLLMPCLALNGERLGFAPSESLPERWTHFRQIHGGDLLDPAVQKRVNLRPEVGRAIARGLVGMKQVDANWFIAAGRVGADAQDAILIREPPPDLIGCAPAFLPGWMQWFKRDNSQIEGLAAIRDQTGLLQSATDVGFTGGVRIAHAGAYLRIVGFGPRAASSNAAWWSATPDTGGSPITIQGQEIDARALADGPWNCRCFDGMGKVLGSSSLLLTSQLPLRCSFPLPAVSDRLETSDPGTDASMHATAFLRQERPAEGSGHAGEMEPLDSTGRWYFDAVHHPLLTDERGQNGSAEAFSTVRSGRDDLLRVLIGRSCDRATPVGWGAFADDLQMVMNRLIKPGTKAGTFRHAGPIIRAWEESGFIDVVNRPWAGLCIIPRLPRWTIVAMPDGRWRAMATGLVSPQQRELVMDGLRTLVPSGCTIGMKHAVNPYVPSVIQVDGTGGNGWIMEVAHQAGFSGPERLPVAALCSALEGTRPIGEMADQLLSQPLDRNQYAEDVEALPPLSIGQVSVQRTRATGMPSRWFIEDRRTGRGSGAMSTSRNWAYLLARYRAGIGKPITGGSGVVIPLLNEVPDCFLPIGLARALSLCGQRLPGPFMKANGERFYGVPMSSSHRQLIARILR